MSIQALKRRIISTKNTQKVTKVIQMIANSKLKNIQKRIEVANKMLNEISNEKFENIKYKNRTETLYIAIGSDSGFCGSINSTVCKYLNSIKTNHNKLIIFGKKLNQIYRFRTINSSYIHILNLKELEFISSENLELKMTDILEEINNLIFHKDSNITEVKIIYHEFKNILSKNFKTEELINFKENKHNSQLCSNLTEDEIDKVKLRVSILINKAIQSNLGSVISSRISAMNSASNNAEDISKELKIKYNKIRQEKINKELLDIVAGSI